MGDDAWLALQELPIGAAKAAVVTRVRAGSHDSTEFNVELSGFADV